MRQPIVAGNWKMYRGPSEARRLALEIKKGLLGSRGTAEVVVCPPFVSLAAVGEILHGTNIGLGAQNVFWEKQGAWTGEVAAGMLRDAGCSYVIVGHSERRQHFGETNATVKRRLQSALDVGLHAIVCVGETLAERDGGSTLDVVRRQTDAALLDFEPTDIRNLCIAYEPVWAIGTGRTATPSQAEEVHAEIRNIVGAIAGADIASAVRILYGGSVKPDNVDSLMAEPDVDGALVGGASLDVESFARIVEFRS